MTHPQLVAGLMLLMLASVRADEKSQRFEDEPIGWASVEGETTGGKGGVVVRVSDEAALAEKVKGDKPATIIITGPIALKANVRVGSNKTIVGEGSKAELTGSGLHVSKVKNVIIRNLAIHDSDNDAISIDGESHHIWVDHCDLSRSHDGLLDIKHGSDLVTVSWCRFHDHHKTCLLGHSDKPSALAEDKGKLRVTYHHNYFDGSQTRHPRVRIAETVHIFNNYYRDNEYGAASTNNAGLLVEGNYFEQVKAPTHTRYGDSKEPGRLVERLNHFVESGKPETAGSVKEVPYKYSLDKAESVAARVREGAGVGKVVLLASSALAQDTPKQPDPLGSGDHTRTLTMGEQKRTYLVHVPKDYDSEKPTPVVLALHGLAMDGSMMVWFSGLNKKSDESGFIVVYPSGTGLGPFRSWNAGGFRGKMAEGGADDVAFIGKLLDDLSTLVKVDEKRVYACGMSNGAMMCYRLAAELSDRIAAIAPVAGTIAIDESKPLRPVPVMHFHGSKDNIVPFEMKKGRTPSFMKLKGVEDSIQTWVKLNGCDEPPIFETISKDDDEMKVTRKTYGGGRDESEVVLIVIEEGGHTWPGQQPPVEFIGKSVKTVSANDQMWKFFQRHKLK